jgi:hypothetical protein
LSDATRASATFAFADPTARVYGLASLGAAGNGCSLLVLFDGGRPVLVRAGDDVPLEAGPAHERLRYDDGEHAVELVFHAAGPSAELGDGEPAVRAGGMVRDEQLCHVHGTVRFPGEAREVRSLGQRGLTWGDIDWDRIEATRNVGAWLEDGSGVMLNAVRPAGDTTHEHEAVWAAVVGAAGTLRVDQPRLSTTYDDEGRQQRAGLELWIGEDDEHPRRAAGEVLCGSTLDLGSLRLDCSFVRWRMAGRTGIGRYDLMRRA